VGTFPSPPRLRDELEKQPAGQLRQPFHPLELDGQGERENAGAEAANSDEEERVEPQWKHGRDHHHVYGAGELHAHQPSRRA